VNRYERARELLDALSRTWELEKRYRRELAELLSAMRHAADPALNPMLRRGREIGLTLQELGDMIGTSREAARQRLMCSDTYLDRGALDPVPEHIVARLRALQASATRLRGNHGADSPARLAKPLLLALLLALRAEGVSYGTVSEILGVGLDAVAARYRNTRHMGHREAQAVLASVPLDPDEEWKLPTLSATQ
jgi:hypothetical protein